MYGAGVWSACLQHVVVRALFAAKGAKAAAWTGAFTVAVNAALNVALAGPLREAGLALATTVTTTLQVVVLALLLKKRVPEIVWTPVCVFALRPVLASAVMAAACWGLLNVLPARPAVRALVPVAAGGLVYFGASFAMRVGEARDVFAFRRRRAG
jgi:putative peptidoglycan lipid II flippase